MSKSQFSLFALAAAGFLAATTVHAQEFPGLTGTETGFFEFQTRCMGCHGNPAFAERAPSPEAIRQMSPEKIYEALTTGVMRTQGEGMSDQQKRMLALFMSGRPLGSADQGDAARMKGRCESNPALADPAAGPAWNGWGASLTNTRFQPNPGFTAGQIPNLKLKWAFGFPTGVSAYGQPTVASGRIFVGSDNGYVYSLNAKSGCVYWSFRALGSVRNAINIGPIEGQGDAKYAIYFGDSHANVYAVDAQTGKQLWTKSVDDHFTARITAAPALNEGRLYVPVSSSEEFTGGHADYQCCTFRGSVVALNANTGAQIWKTYTIRDEPSPRGKNAKGTQLWAPAGGSVWNTPTVDVKRNLIYFGTGDSETEPAEPTSDAVMALDLDTGEERWVHQATADDAFMGGCFGATKTGNCPKEPGPDADIGNSPMLQTLSGGREILVVATKDGRAMALDPESGDPAWSVDMTPETAERPPNGVMGLNGVTFGGASDGERAYYPLTGGGMVAVQLATGESVWRVPLAKEGARVGHSAAPTAIPGAVFVGGSDGILHAVSPNDGAILWSVETAHDFETVNGVAAKGGAMSAAGPTVVDGMLYVNSGYAVIGGIPGNVLLAFGLE